MSALIGLSRDIRIALLGITLALGVSAPGYAQQPVAQEQASVNFDVPAGEINAAMVRFSQQSGLQFSVDSALTGGKRTAGLKGKYTPDEGLRALLAGSGLTFRFTGPRTVVIEAGPRVGGNTKVLGPVRVEGSNDSSSAVNGVNGSRDVTATEGTGSFTSGALAVGSKAPQSLKDTTQSVSVLTAERMKQQNVTDFKTAMNQLPGITLAQGNSGLENTFYSRGFEINSIQVDGGAPLQTGIKPLGGTNFYPLIDMSIYDHVELLRGAAGYNGYGEPGGTVNLVRKKPLDHAQVTLESQAGSWDTYRISADATSPLALDGKLRGRVVMTYQDNEYFYDIARDNKTLIYGIAEMDATPTTLLSVGASYTSQQSVPWRLGLPRYIDGSDLELPRDKCLCFPWNRWDLDTTEIFATIEQKIGVDWTAKINFTGNHQTGLQKFAQSSGAVNNRQDASVRNAGPLMTTFFSDSSSKQRLTEGTLAGGFDIFGQHQELTLGASRTDIDGRGLVAYTNPISGASAAAPYRPYPGGPAYYPGSANGSAPPIDVFAFDPNNLIYSQPGDPLPSVHYPDWNQVQWLTYASLRLTAFNRLHLFTNARWGRIDYRKTSENFCTSIPATGTPASDNCVGRQIGDTYSRTSRHFGDSQASWPPAVTLSFDVSPSFNLYVGYTDIYQSQGERLDRDLNPIEPITGANWEAGLKWQARDGRLNLSASGFSISQKGFYDIDDVRDSNVTPEEQARGVRYYVVTSDGSRIPNGTLGDGRFCCYKGNRDLAYTSKGMDIDVTGEILTGWQLSASYIYDRTKQEGSFAGAEEGLPYTSIQPEHNYKLWTSYDFGAGGVQSWLSAVTLSLGVNGQSSGYRSGSACPSEWIVTNPITGIGTCASGKTVPFSFTVEPYTLLSARVAYRLPKNWALAVNLENLLDKTYYQSVGSSTSGNWYGAPRSVMVSLRGSW